MVNTGGANTLAEQRKAKYHPTSLSNCLLIWLVKIQRGTSHLTSSDELSRMAPTTAAMPSHSQRRFSIRIARAREASPTRRDHYWKVWHQWPNERRGLGAHLV